MCAFHLLPRDERFFGMFQRSASNLAAGAQALAALLEQYEKVERKTNIIRE